MVHRLHIRLYLEKPINPPNPGRVCNTLKSANLDWIFKPQLEKPVYLKEKNVHHTSELDRYPLSATGWGGVRMGLQKSACKRGRTSSISGLLTNLQIKKCAKVYSKVCTPGPWRVRRARAALSASLPRRLSGRRGRERPLPIKPLKSEIFMFDCGLGRSPGCARDGVKSGCFSHEPSTENRTGVLPLHPD